MLDPKAKQELLDKMTINIPPRHGMSSAITVPWSDTLELLEELRKIESRHEAVKGPHRNKLSDRTDNI